MNLRQMLTLAVSALLLAACASGAQNDATLGALLRTPYGNGTERMAAVAPGIMGGAFVGSPVGRSMDQVDRLKHQQAIDQAATASVGKTVRWSNPDSGHNGAVTTLRDGTLSEGLYCREYRQSVTAGGETAEATGIACQQADGSWKRAAN